MLIKFLIIFFSLLIIYQIYIFYSREGLENEKDGYQQYSESTAVLTEKNAANIQVLKEEIDKCKDVKTLVNNLNEQVQTIQEQVNAINDSMVDGKLPNDFNVNDASDNINDYDTSDALDVVS
jgi:hypothetical protein